MQFMGFDGFIWFMGVVEDRRDPMCLGRCKVRIAGLHTEKQEQGIDEGIPTTDLPWAHPMQPITSAAMNGIGTTPLGPVEGTWVVGFFRDGEACQDPIMMGTLGGYPTKPPAKTGFNDPNGVYPKVTHLMEPDTHRRARKDFEGPPDVGGGSSKGTDLPMDNYAAVYPFNHVRASESGHVEEWDDTPGAERLMRYHKSGTWEEIGPDGTRTVNVMMDNYHIVAGDENITVTGDVTFKVEGELTFEAKNDITFKSIGGDVNIDAGGACNIDSTDDCTITSGAGITTEAGAVNWVKGAGLKLN